MYINMFYKVDYDFDKEDYKGYDADLRNAIAKRKKSVNKIILS